MPEGEIKVLDGLVHVMEKDGGLDREAALANMRFNFIEKLCEKTVVKPAESREHKRSVAIDHILTGKYTAIPCFVGIMAIVFVMTFNYLGAWLSDGMSMVVNWVIALIGRGLEAAGVSSVLQSLVVDGILSGIGSVIGFLPTIVTLFFLSVNPGRYRIYGSCSLCYGQASSKDRTFRKKLCADADRIRLFGAGYYGNQNIIQ